MERMNERIEWSLCSLLKSMAMKVVMMVLLLQGIWMSAAHAVGVGGNGMYQWSVALRGYISNETGKAPVA